MLQQKSAEFPTPLHLFQISAPGKCKVLNEAVKIANGDILAFLDDDVIVDADWLDATEELRRGFVEHPELDPAIVGLDRG